MSDSESQNRHDDTLQAINQILPEIQQQLTEQLRQEIQEQINKQLQQQIIEVMAQAQQQFLNVIDSLNQEKQKLQQQKVTPIYLKIVDLETQTKERQMRQFSQLQDKFLLTQFDQKILKHPNIEKLQIQIEQQLFEKQDIAVRFEGNKIRKLKEISIQIQQRQEKFKKQKDKVIRKKQCAQSGIQQLKKDIQVFSVRIAQLKSEYNIKIHKIDTEIKTDKAKCRQFQACQDLNELKKKLQNLKRINKQNQLNKQVKIKGVEQVLMQEQMLQNSSEQEQNNSNAIYNYSSSHGNNAIIEKNFDTFNRQNKKFPNQKKSHKLSQFQKNQIIRSITSNGFGQANNFNQQEVIIQSSSQQCQQLSQKQNLLKFKHIQKVNKNRQHNKLIDFQNNLNQRGLNNNLDSQSFEKSEKSVSRGHIIDLDISKLLRERWEDQSSLDPLGKYLSKGSIYDQNNSNLQNCGRSQFYEQYLNYLKKIGGVSNNSYQYIQSQKGKGKQLKAMKKLSEGAKEQLIKKIAVSGFTYV